MEVCYYKGMAKKYTDEQDRLWLEALPKKKVAVKVIVKSDNGSVLLVKPDYKDTWQLLGGGVEVGEEPKQAAVRESKEEANIDVDPKDLRIVGTAFKPNEDYLILIYEYQKTVEGVADFSVEDEEIEEYKFILSSDVANLLPSYYKEFWGTYAP